MIEDAERWAAVARALGPVITTSLVVLFMFSRWILPPAVRLAVAWLRRSESSEAPALPERRTDLAELREELADRHRQGLDVAAARHRELLGEIAAAQRGHGDP